MARRVLTGSNRRLLRFIVMTVLMVVIQDQVQNPVLKIVNANK